MIDTSQKENAGPGPSFRETPKHRRGGRDLFSQFWGRYADGQQPVVEGSLAFPKIKQVRAFVVRGGGADYHDQGGGHWIDDHIATPMARYPEYRQSRQSFGINVLGTLVVEIEAENGVTGFAVTTGGEPACFIVEKHLARFLEGRDPAQVEKIWDQMYFSTQYYGRKGLVINAISGVDLALWDLLGRLRQEPVHQLLRRGTRRVGVLRNGRATRPCQADGLQGL